MSNRSPRNNLRTVEQAIALRAIGHTWEEVAKRVRKKVETVRSYPRRYPEFWAARMAEAQKEQDEEVLGEARAVLRFHMRTDKKDGESCARILLDHARRRLPLATGAAPAPAPKSHYHQVADYLEGLSDEKRQQLLDSDSPDEPAWEGDEGLLPPTVRRGGIGG